jgi:hypothetical protein
LDEPTALLSLSVRKGCKALMALIGASPKGSFAFAQRLAPAFDDIAERPLLARSPTKPSLSLASTS